MTRKRETLPRSTWLQVAGDMSPEDYGGIFAQGERYRDRTMDEIRLLRIERKTDLVGRDALTGNDPEAYWTTEIWADRDDIVDLWEGEAGETIREAFTDARGNGPDWPNPRRCSLFRLACLAAEMVVYDYLADQSDSMSGHEISKRYRLRDFNGRTIRRAFKVGQWEHDQEVRDYAR